MKNAVTLLVLLVSLQSQAQNNVEPKFRMELKNDWRMQSSTDVSADGSAVSKTDFSTQGWYPVDVPTTIVAGLLANHVYPFDPFFATNLEKIAGPQFDKPWWFRKTFTLPASEKGKTITIEMHGINYTANLWLNGVLIADSTRLKGPFRIFELDITPQVHFDGTNVLALEIMRPFNPQKRDGDLAIDYADWIHYPADYNGGIVNEVVLNTCDKVAVRYPLVTTKFDLPSLDVAHLSVDAQVINFSDEVQSAVISGRINDDIHFEQKVELQPRESRDITFTPAEYPQLNVKHPRIWWNWQYGKPELNHIELQVMRHGEVTNAVAENFGIRQITSRLINNASREFSINGKPILLRGAAWSPDIFQRHSLQREQREIRYVRDMNMNIIRSEGKFEDDNFYDLCDRNGLLVMTGWMCCGAWQYPENWSPAERTVAMESAKSMMFWLRNKACIFIWLNGSDMPPRDTSVERDYLTIEANLKWPNPTISTADASKSKVSGYSGVKMDGPYDWVPPIYWESDTARYGGAWSFATEISPGPSIPPYESLVKFMDKDSIWYTNSEWLYHSGTSQFKNTDIFNDALKNRYGPSNDIKNFVTKAQAQNYEGHRAMMEAYGLNKYHTATGVVQWMLCNPWPGLIWHTYDYYLYPAGTYFGMKKALEPLHVQYSYTSHEAIVTNSLLQAFTGLKVKAAVYSPDGSLRLSKDAVVGIAADGVTRCFTVPPPADSLYFVRLELDDQEGRTVSINWYWLSAKSDELNWKKSKWFYTPQSGFADFSGLASLPNTTLQVSQTSHRMDDSTVHTVTVKNTGKSVAFFVHLRLLKGKDGDDILPIIFQDNYLLLAPGESRTIDCRYNNADAGSTTPYLLTSAWNLDTSGSHTTGDSGLVDALSSK